MAIFGAGGGLQQPILAFLTGIGTVVSMYYGGRALRAKAVADKGIQELEIVKVSQASMVEALTQARIDNQALRADNARQELKFDVLEQKYAALRDEFQLERIECQTQLRDLTRKLADMQRRVDKKEQDA